MEILEKEETFAKDMFGNVFEPGDIFFYCSGSQRNDYLKVGVFIDIINYNEDKNPTLVGLHARVKLVNAGNSLSYIKLETFEKRSALLSNPGFNIDNKIIQKAIQTIDDFRDQGLIKKTNQGS